jgi:hypothetical protein
MSLAMAELAVAVQLVVAPWELAMAMAEAAICK